MTRRQDLITLAGNGDHKPLPFGWHDSAELLGRVMLLVDQAAREKPVYMDLPQASKYMGLSVSFLARLIKSGILPCLRDGRRKVRRADLDSLPSAEELQALLADHDAQAASS